MRLLHLNNDGEFSLREYVGKDIPRYAILSHTWGADHEEITIQDVREGTGKSKIGYRKLDFCAKQAAQDNLENFWVDTCCIDKSSSAELSEAINSMFQWYHRADKCYVYLSDVSTGDQVQSELSSQKTWKTAFRCSKWFTRGWTLQELLAPKVVMFFSADRKLLGDKVSLLQEIHNTTDISAQALVGSSLSRFSVDERMAWMKKRETKREEDAAYSLLGIFDICMPLLYGEGREKAFLRLRKEIDSSTQITGRGKKSNQQIRITKSSPSSTVPFRRDDDFVFRDSLDGIRLICARPAGCAALVGLGGVGKSQVAIEYAYQVRDKSPDTWVFWVHAGTRARFEEGYRRIAEATKMDGWNDPKADVLRLVRSWLCDESNGRWLMVIDNADDASVFFPVTSQRRTVTNSDQQADVLSDFLPQSPNGSILITSRSQDVAYRLTGKYASIIEVRPMNKDDALILLQKKLGSIANEDEAVELIRTLDSMPLALTQAAAFIKQRAPRMTILRYMSEIQRSDLDRGRLLKKDVGDSRRDGQASNSIIATWQISFEYIRKQTPTAAQLLSLMSLFDRQGIPESLLRDRYAGNGDEDADFDDDIYMLTSFSLIEMSANGQEFEMHRLVQFSTKKWLELSNELEPWKTTYVTLMDESFPKGQYENWPTCQALFPHAEAAFNSQPKDAQALETWASVLFKAAWYATEIGQYRKAYEMDSSAFQVRESVLGAEHPDTLNSINSLGLVLHRQGRYKEAEAMHQRGLEVKKRLFGTGHPDTLISMSNLARTYMDQGRWADAEALEVQVLEISKTKLGADHPDTLVSMSNLSTTYRNQGRWADAEALDVQVVEISKIKLGADHLDTLVYMSNLASTYRTQGRWADAEALDVQVVEISKTKLGAEHPDTLVYMSNLAATHWNQGRWADAEALDVQVLEIRKIKLGADHPSTLDIEGAEQELDIDVDEDKVTADFTNLLSDEELYATPDGSETSATETPPPPLPERTEELVYYETRKGSANPPSCYFARNAMVFHAAAFCDEVGGLEPATSSKR
ncbi:hypothetical protein N0V90_006113 [Kalmusia sp. IMI 367209]|nr:hypothetical protein N0V90_006113 [Kalmusia sp. IMI 367209]